MNTLEGQGRQRSSVIVYGPERQAQKERRTDEELGNLISAVGNNEVKAIVMVGGVACNQIITNQLSEAFKKLNLPFFTPLKKYCCDNADMIAFVAAKKIETGNFNPSQYDQGIFNNAFN